MKNSNEYSELSGIPRIIVLLAAIMFVSSSTGFSATICQQTIEFVGKTEGDTSTLLFYEYVSGECGYYLLHYLQIGPEGLLDSVRTKRDYLTLPLWNDSTTIGKRLEIAELLPRSGDAFVMPFGQTIRAPQFDSVFMQKFRDSVAHYLMPRERFFDQPLTDLEIELLYRYPGGLYKNYQIKDAYLIKQSWVLVLVLYQPITKVGQDTMHGVLIYRIKWPQR